MLIYSMRSIYLSSFKLIPPTVFELCPGQTKPDGGTDGWPDGQADSLIPLLQLHCSKAIKVQTRPEESIASVKKM